MVNTYLQVFDVTIIHVKVACQFFLLIKLYSKFTFSYRYLFPFQIIYSERWWRYHVGRFHDWSVTWQDNLLWTLPVLKAAMYEKCKSVSLQQFNEQDVALTCLKNPSIPWWNEIETVICYKFIYFNIYHFPLLNVFVLNVKIHYVLISLRTSVL